MGAVWKKVYFNIQNIKYQTESAILIQLPHNSSYDGYTMWISNKLIKEGNHSYEKSILYKDDFNFTIQKHNKKREVVDEDEISSLELEDIFKVKDNEEVSYLEITKPKKINKEVRIIEELKND